MSEAQPYQAMRSSGQPHIVDPDATQPGNIGDFYPVTFNVRRASLDEMIRFGAYGWIHPEIVKDDYPILDGPVGVVHGTLIELDPSLTLKRAAAKLASIGFKSADNAEILSFGSDANTWDLQTRVTIIGIGQREEGTCLSLGYDDVDKNRMLGLHWGTLGTRVRCLALPK